MRHYLLVDLGTGNTRVALVNSAGAILDLRTYLNRYYRDGLYEDAQYFLPVEWRENILQGCRELCAAHPDIRVDALSSAGTRQSFVLLDREGKDFYGLPNIDNRGRAFMANGPRRTSARRSCWAFGRSGRSFTAGSGNSPASASGSPGFSPGGP